MSPVLSNVEGTTCPHGGTLVSASEWLPTDPFDFNWGSVAPAIGCNHLRCGACGADVRHAVGFRVPPAEQDALTPAILYVTEDWKTAAHVEHADDETARLYACRCRYHVEPSSSDLDRPELDPIRGFISQWRCAGHPPMPATDLDVDGFADAALRSRGDGAPAGVPKMRPAFALSRMYALLAVSDAARAQALANAAADRLTAPDPVVQRAAIEFFYDHATAPGAERLAPALRDQRDRFAGQADPEVPGADLTERAFTVLQIRGERTGDAEVGAVIRAEILRGGKSAKSLLYALARVDRGWIKDHVAEVAAASAPMVASVVYLLRDEPPDALGAMLAKVAGAPGVSLDALKKEIVRRVPEPGRTTVLAALP